MCRTLTVVFCLVAICILSVCAQTQILIYSPGFQNCPQTNCYTLNEYVTELEETPIESNTVLFFLPGVHPLSHNLTFRNLDRLELIDYGRRILRNQNISSIVYCTGGGQTIAFVNITNLVLYGININNCGREIGEDLSKEAVYLQTRSTHIFDPHLKVAVFAINIQPLTIASVQITQSKGYGLLAVNALENSIVTDSIFDQNNYQTHTPECWNVTLTTDTAVRCQGGNALFVYADTLESNKPTNHTLGITNSLFSRGIDLATTKYDGEYVGASAGLGIILSQFDYGAKVNLIQVYSFLNTAQQGANFYFRIFNTVINSSIHMEKCDSAVANGLYLPLTQESFFATLGSGAGMYFIHGVVDNTQRVLKTRTKEQIETTPLTTILEEVLTIENSVFRSNFALGGGGLSIILYTSFNRDNVQRIRTIAIRYSNITENTADIGSGMLLYDYSSISVNEPVRFILDNLRIEGNRPIINVSLTLASDNVQPDFIGSVITSTIQSTISLYTIQHAVMRDCVFSDNHYSAIALIDSIVYMEGQNYFTGNLGDNGAALFLTRIATIFLRPNTKLVFENNRVTGRGGAVYSVKSGLFSFDIGCVFQVLDPSLLPLSQLNIELIFINNSAIESGDAMFGGFLDRCISSAPSGFLYHNSSQLGHEFDFVANISGQPDTNSIISSNVEDVCFCFEGVHNCSNRTIRVETYPGEQFRISLVGVGQRGGTVPVITQAFFYTGLDEQAQSLQRTGRTCSNNVYRMRSAREYEPIIVVADEISPTSLQPNLISVRLLRPCPVGFGFNNESKICDCEIRLLERNMTCDIDTRFIIRTPPYWLSNYSNHLLLHDHCPFDYCKTTPVEISMQEPNISKQCAFNRYGRLCGQCEQGFSAAFGTSRCLHCSNVYLLLIVPLAIAGLILVVFLFVLNLTVAEGTINGLIFYANVFKINEAIFLSPGDKSFFKVFISWVNLDLGIETCFYNGMDSFAKTGLQFVFPFYLWVILIAIIIGSRFSSLLVKLCGRHAVSVLATVFLLSYTKLLRVIITSLSFTSLNYSDGDRGVWLYDGNLDFGQGKHIGLVILALSALVVIAIPYTLLILFVQLLRRYSDKAFLKWVTKLMPIFDSYLGPHKHTHGYWTGFLLLIRVILAVVFAFNVSGDPAVNVMVITLTAVLLVTVSLSFGGVYKQAYLTALELSFVINLGVLSVVTGYILQTGGNQNIAGYISIAVAFLTFISVCIFHAVKRGKKFFKKTLRRKKAKERKESEPRGNTKEHSPEVVEIDYNNVTTTVVDITDREDTDTL